MGSLKSRIVRLEEHSINAEWEGLSAPQRHYRLAFERATRDEQKAIKRLAEEGKEQELAKLWEKVLRRQAPTLANDIRVHRDLLSRELDALEDELREQGYHRRAGEERHLCSKVVTAKVNRATVISRGLEPLEDAEEAHSLVLRTTAPGTPLSEVLEIVGWGAM
jgi:hypothetical protein